VPTADWALTLRDVGARLRSRTLDSHMTEQGTFTADTRPTATQVNDLMPQALGDVAVATGSDLPSKYWEAARSVAALRTALLIELTYYPEQINTGRSPYAQLKELYDDALKALVKAVADEQEVPGGDTSEVAPVYSFPAYSNPELIPIPETRDPLGFTTRW
jgi:hypothetical protein